MWAVFTTTGTARRTEGGGIPVSAGMKRAKSSAIQRSKRTKDGFAAGVPPCATPAGAITPRRQGVFPSGVRGVAFDPGSGWNTVGASWTASTAAANPAKSG